MHQPITNPLTRSPQTPRLPQQQKLQTSINTATTSNNCFTKLMPSLLNCQSSVSVERAEGRQGSKWKAEKKLFMKFLAAGGKDGARERVLEEMGRVYRETEGKTDSKNQSIIFGQTIPPITYTPYQIPQSPLPILHHFLEIWLLQMGYKTEPNKQMIIERARILIPDNEIYIAVVFYELLGYGLIGAEERWELVVGTCRNGWEFFCGRLVQVWRRGCKGMKRLGERGFDWKQLRK